MFQSWNKHCKMSCEIHISIQSHVTSLPQYLQGAGSYSKSIKKVEEDIKNSLKKVNELTGTANTEMNARKK